MSAISRYVLLVLFVLVNLVAFALMGVDKQRARTHQWRVPEKTLFLAALLFGFIDALVMRLQNVGFPSTLTSTFPYVGTVLLMVFVVCRANQKKKKLARLSQQA